MKSPSFLPGFHNKMCLVASMKAALAQIPPSKSGMLNRKKYLLCKMGPSSGSQTRRPPFAHHATRDSTGASGVTIAVSAEKCSAVTALRRLKS